MAKKIIRLKESVLHDIINETYIIITKYKEIYSKSETNGLLAEIENMLESKVNLQLWVKVKKDWRDSEFLLKNFGYNQKEYE